MISAIYQFGAIHTATLQTKVTNGVLCSAKSKIIPSIIPALYKLHMECEMWILQTKIRRVTAVTSILYISV